MARQISRLGSTVGLAVWLCVGSLNAHANAQTGPDAAGHESTPVQPSPLAKNVEDRSLGHPREAKNNVVATNPAIGDAARTLISLAGVVALAVFASLVIRKVARSSGALSAAIGPGGRAPAGVLEVLGRYPIARGQTLVLLKLDRRVLLVSQCAGARGSTGAISSLCEIDDPEEVASLLMKTRDAESATLSSRFEKSMGDAQRQADLAEFSDEETRARRTIVAPSGDRLELLGEGDQVRPATESVTRGFIASFPDRFPAGACANTEPRPDIDAATEILRRRLVLLEKSKRDAARGESSGGVE